jgi:hypothetical protein
MKTPLTYGALSAAITAAITLLLFFLGYHSPEKLGTAQAIGTVVGVVASILAIVLGMRARRAELPPHEAFTYGRALGVGILVALFGGLFGALFQALYTTVINTGFNDTLIAYQTGKWEAAGMSAEQIEGAEKITRLMLNPALQVLFGLLFSALWGTIVSLIAAAILKRPAAPISAPPPPLV